MFTCLEEIYKFTKIICEVKLKIKCLFVKRVFQPFEDTLPL